MKPTETDYPEELSLEDFDKMPWKEHKQFGLDSPLSISKLAQHARKHARKTCGILYTQVDSGEKRVYVKGEHLINRTGLFEVVKL